MTRAQTCIKLSHITGFTLPGMIELPGWWRGWRSHRCALGTGTEPAHVIGDLKRLVAMVLIWPLASTSASLQTEPRNGPWLPKRKMSLLRQQGNGPRREIRMTIQPCAHRGAAEGSSMMALSAL